MKAILIQHVYPGHGFLPLVQKCFERNTAYCERFAIDYLFAFSESLEFEAGGWEKLTHIQRALAQGYELVIWLDADAILLDLERDLREVPNPPDTIGAVQFLLPSPHLNVGVLYFRNGERVRDFLGKWLAEFPGRGAWREQTEFNRLRNEAVFVLPQEWNRNYSNNPYVQAVVLGFHGFGSAENRLELMSRFLDVKETA